MPEYFRARLAFLLCALVISSCAGRFQDVPANPPPVTTSEFAALLSTTARAPWTKRNRIKTFENGDGYFPPMLEAIEAAEKTITFETFVFKQGVVGRRFSLAFAAAARRGVEVRIVLDANGSRWVNEDDVATMRRAGVELHFYRPFRPLAPQRYNARTHRKTMVVDGRIAYTGGAGYTDLWTGDAHSPQHWRDTQYEIRGPVVRQIQEGFNENWQEVAGYSVAGPRYFPSLSPVGDTIAHFSLGSPGRRADTLGSSLLLAINAAQQSILIEHAYFIPHADLLDALVRARRQGVSIDIIVCGEHTDFPVCRIAQRPALRELRRAGVRIWEYHSTMLHGKLVVIDDYLAVVGSANFDDRSFFINDEANLHVLSHSFAQDQRRMFERDLRQSILLAPADLRLPFHELPAHLGAQLIKSQL